jgi:hypothetical protein
MAERFDDVTENAIAEMLRAGLSHGNVEKLPTKECGLCNKAESELRRCITVHGQRRVREFAEFLATTASPKGTVQREKLQGFATEFLNG